MLILLDTTDTVVACLDEDREPHVVTYDDEFYDFEDEQGGDRIYRLRESS